jgi:predicted phosphodiesterase
MQPDHAALDDLIRARVASGQAQKSVARELGVTEWRVRCVIRSEVTRLIVRRETKEVRLRRITKEPVDAIRCLVLSDIHIPYHDHAALGVALAYARDYRPTHIILNGDILDAHEVSSHPKDRHNVVTFQDEVNETRQFLRVLRQQHKKAQIYYTMGNHENRIERYLTQHAPELSSVTSLALDELLGMQANRITFVDSRNKVRVGPFEVFHGSVIRKDSGNSVRGHMQRRGGSVAMGHTHRMAVVSKTDRHGVHWGLENGHLSEPDPSWAFDPDWQQGFSQIDVYDGAVSIRQHHVNNGRLLVDGKLYKAQDHDQESGSVRSGKDSAGVSRARSRAGSRELVAKRRTRKGRSS